MRSKYKFSSILMQSGLAIFIILSIYIGKTLFYPHSIPKSNYSIIISKNTSLRTTTRILESDNVINNPKLLEYIIRIRGSDKRIVAGMYIIKEPISLWELSNRLTSGKPDQLSVTIIDGWNFKQIKSYIDKLDNITHLTKDQTEADIIKQLHIPYSKLEGMLYPNTFFVMPGQTDLEIYQTAYKMMQQKLQHLYVNRSANSILNTPYQIAILASLIEKETSKPEDMINVATVFNNRLRVGMRLQDDPAVFYGLGNKETITRADFKINTPYNTYMNKGLPPTPICTPSEKALQAAANPTNETKLLYFIAIGGGKSKFNESFDGHAKDVNTYLRKSKPEQKNTPSNKGTN